MIPMFHARIMDLKSLTSSMILVTFSRSTTGILLAHLKVQVVGLFMDSLERESQSLSNKGPSKSRKSRLGRSVEPAGFKDYYQVEMLYMNKGDVSRDAVKIKDFVPSNFSVFASTMDYKVKETKGGRMLTWKIDRVAPGQEFAVKYFMHKES